MKNNYAQLGQGFAHPENDSDDISATFLGEDRDENILTAIQVFNQNCGEEPSGEQLAEKSRVLYPAETIAAQPLGSMPCLRSSARASSFIQLPRLIPARSAASFNCWRNSELIRIWKVGDQPSPLGVLSRFAVDTYVHNLIVWNLLCTYVITSYIEKTTPQTVGAVPGRLAKTLSEVTLWLALSLPKHAPNLHGVFSPWVSSQIRSSMLLPPPNAKPAQKRLQDVSVFCHVASVLKGYIMFNLQTLTAKARELRGNVVKAATTKGTRTMTPVYEREEQRKLRERIQQTQADWVLLWWDIATVTGWRTSDVCNFRYSCINWETGTATIIVAKQTKAAEARATRKGIEIVRQQRKDAARLAGDHIAYMQWDSVSCDELAAGMSNEEQTIVFELVAKAEVKHDTKQLPPGIIKRLRERMERNLISDDLVFSRSQIESNRCQSLEGSVSRQTIWKKLHNVMVWFTRVVNTRLRLSAYSSRKIAAFNMMSAGGEQGLLVASEMLGHSNPAITRTYLQLGSKASAIQSRLAMEVSV